MGILLAVILFWTVMGVQFYERVPPFWDSLAFQGDYVRALDAAEEDRFGIAWKTITTPRNDNILYELLAIAFEPVLPRSVTGLYIVSFTVLLAAGFMIIYAAWAITQSRLIAVGVMLALLACGTSRYTYDGFVDQRSDLIAGVCLVAVALSVWLLMLRPGASLHWFLAGVAILICVLQRPVSVAQLALLGPAFVLLDYRCWPHVWLNLTPKNIALLAMPLALCLAFLLNSAGALADYYLDRNIDVGSHDSFLTSFAFAVRSVGWAFGWPMIGGLAGAVLLLLWRTRWPELLRLAAVTAVGIGPFVLSRSGNNYVVLVGCAFLVVAVATMVLKTLPQRAAQGITLATALLVLFNLYSLASDVSRIDPSDRRLMEEFMVELRRGQTTVNVSGTDTIVDAILTLEVLEGRSQVQKGYTFSKQTHIGLPRDYDPADVGPALDQAVQKLCVRPGVIIAPAPSQRNGPANELLSRRYVEEVGARIRSLDCLGDEVARLRHGNRDFVVYTVR